HRRQAFACRAEHRRRSPNRQDRNRPNHARRRNSFHGCLPCKLTGGILSKSLECRARFVQTGPVPRWIMGGWLVFPLLAASLQAQDTRPAADTRATLNTYCTGCHNARLRTGGLALDQFDPDRVAAAPDVWEKVARKLRTHEMPPAGARRPDDEVYRRVITSLESDLDAAAVAAPRPGRVPVHRLNRT